MPQFQELIHDKICENLLNVQNWFKTKLEQIPYPIYSSYDIRDSGCKISNVDANIYPAGFNNICPTDLEAAPWLLKNYIHQHYGANFKRFVIVTEEHSKNPYYWHNIATLKKIFIEAGFSAELAFAGKLDAPLKMESVVGETLLVHSGDPETSSFLKEFQPDLFISNNDFSDEKAAWGSKVKTPINPPRELGWYHRKKSDYFYFYNELVNEFCKLIGVQPFYMEIKTELFSEFNLENEESNKKLANQIDAFLATLELSYKQMGVQYPPFVYIKNNSGTYGLGVIKVHSGEEYLNLNYNNRKKMKAAKGGRSIEEVIIQEGIPSIIKDDAGVTAEPVIYMLGHELVGGFLRTHSAKSETESLNSPGAVYKRLCVSDLAVNARGCPNENVYGWCAKLGLLAIAREGKKLAVNFKGFS